jgi:hypothetical protein
VYIALKRVRESTEKVLKRAQMVEGNLSSFENVEHDHDAVKATDSP